MNVKTTHVLRLIPPTRGTSLRHSRGLCTSQWLRQTKQDTVPVVTHDGKTSRTTLHVDRSHPVVESRTSDEGREAQPFDKSVLSKLTPTMRSFALDGKIAVVTGLVISLFVYSETSIAVRSAATSFPICYTLYLY